MAQTKVRVRDIKDVSGEVNVAGRDIIKNINTIHQRALTAAEKAARARKMESKLLAQGVATLIQNLSAQAREGAQSDTPYKGLLSYGLNEAEIFYGRKEAKKDLLNCLKQGSLSVLHAESGAGKTSLLQAGIAAQLIANGHLIVYLRPHNADPVEFIKRMFLPELAQATTLTAVSLREFLRQVCAVLGPKANLYLLLDQFEEFFNLLKKEERQPFVESLADCLDDPSLKVRWVLALRAEALSDLAELETFGITPFKNMYRLNRLSREEAREAIIEPAKGYEITFEPALIDHILDTLTTNDEVMPTHLQLVCSALTDDLPEDKTLTLAFYTEHEGDTEGILRDYLKRQLDHLPREERALAWKVLRALITADRQRTVKTYDEIAHELESSGVSKEQIDTILARLMERRLLFSQPATTETFELAHDYLVKEIQLDPQERARKAAQELLDQETRTYQRHKTLLSPQRLALIEPYRNELRFSTDGEVLLNESKKAAEQEQRARERRRNITVVISSAVAIIMSVLAILAVRASDEAVQQRQLAEVQAKIARAGELAAQSVSLREEDFQLSLLLGIEAFYTFDTSRSRGNLVDVTRANPQLLKIFTAYGDSALSATFSPDGNTLALGSDIYAGRITLWDMGTHQQIARLLHGQDSVVLTMAFSPDGKMLASASGDIILWNVESSEQIGEPLQGGAVFSVVFSPDGKTLASAGDAGIILWDVDTHKPIGEPLQGASGSSVVFSPDGKTLASAGDAGIILWDINTHEQIGKLSQVQDRPVLSMAFSPDGKTLASAGDDSTILLWDTDTHQQIGELLREDENPVSHMIFSPDGKILASGSNANTIILWDVDTHEPIGEPLQGNGSSVLSLAFSPDGKTLASGSDFGSILWKVDPYEQIGEPIQVQGGPVSSAAFSPDGKTLASAGDDGTILLWDTDTHEQIGGPLQGHAGFVADVSFKSDDKTLASADGGSIILWNVATQQRVGELIHKKGSLVASVVFSPDGEMLASASDDGSIILWDADAHKQIGEPLHGPTGYVNCVAFSPDGKMLASSYFQGTIILWDVETRQKIHELSVGDCNACVPVFGVNVPVVFSPDGKTLASADGGSINLWDVHTYQQIAKMRHSVSSLVFSPDGQMLASGSILGTINLWDVGTHQQIGEPLRGGDMNVWSVAFSPDGKTLASVSQDGNIILWDVNPQSWVEKSCQRAGRNFTRAESAQYFPGEEYHKTCEQWSLDPEAKPVPSPTP